MMSVPVSGAIFAARGRPEPFLPSNHSLAMQLRNWNYVIPAAIAGIVATIVFDIFGFLAQGEWAVPGMLAMTLEAPFIVGVLMHYGIGITLAVVFAGLLPLFFGPIWVRGMIFASIQTILGVWLFMMPMMGMGIAGAESPMGVMMGVMSLVQHWFFGATLGLVYAAAVKRLVGNAAPGGHEAAGTHDGSTARTREPVVHE
jgi:hypothetical protein